MAEGDGSGSGFEPGFSPPVVGLVAGVGAVLSIVVVVGACACLHERPRPPPSDLAQVTIEVQPESSSKGLVTIGKVRTKEDLRADLSRGDSSPRFATAAVQTYACASPADGDGDRPQLYVDAASQEPSLAFDGGSSTVTSPRQPKPLPSSKASSRPTTSGGSNAVTSHRRPKPAKSTATTTGGDSTGTYVDLKPVQRTPGASAGPESNPSLDYLHPSNLSVPSTCGPPASMSDSGYAIPYTHQLRSRDQPNDTLYDTRIINTDLHPKDASQTELKLPFRCQ